MLPIPIVWTEYTTVVCGRVAKLVPCEHCGTEYVYILEREAAGSGKSFYLLNEDGARQESETGAGESLRSYLENDFDPVPCPVCGHYQRHMFPKLYDGGSTWVPLARLMAIAAGCLSAIGVVYCVLGYFQRSDKYALVRSGVLIGLLAVLGLIVAALNRVEQSQARHFDPNTEDQQARIAKGRLRALTRAEFEAQQAKSAGASEPGAGSV